MRAKNCLKAKIIFVVYLIATLALLLVGYSVQSPKVALQEFPFTITYTYEGKTETLSEVYVVEYIRTEKYIGDHDLAWFGYIKDHNRLETDYITIDQQDDKSFAINLHIDPGYIMGDPAHANAVGEPEPVYHMFDGTNDISVYDPAELAELGIAIVDWEYPTPIENKFGYGGISLSSQATVLTTVIAVVALIATMIAIKKDTETVYGKLDKLSVAVNFLMTFVALPFVLIAAVLSEIVADASFGQQLLYLSPAMIAIGIAASVALRRMGYRVIGFWSQFIGPAVFALLIVMTSL